MTETARVTFTGEGGGRGKGGAQVDILGQCLQMTFLRQSASCFIRTQLTEKSFGNLSKSVKSVKVLVL